MAASSAEPATVNDGDLRDRLVLSMVNEAARTIDEKVVDAPEDVDFGMIMGTGFPPFRGGLLRYADSVGLDKIISRLKEFESKFGLRFKPSQAILKRAEQKKKFYE